MTGSFSDRYAVRVLDDGGVAIDLQTGDFVRLNRSAAIVCEELLSGRGTAATAQQVAARLGIAPEQALAAVEETVSALALPAPRRSAPGAFRYGPATSGPGYELSVAGHPRVAVSEDGRLIQLRSTDELREAQLYEFVRAMAPKILFLRGSAVLHGAACLLNGKLLAICGESGAGKTTTIRAFVAAGARPVSEDLLVLIAGGQPSASIYLDGERIVHGWARRTAKHLLSAPHESSTADLEQSLTGAALPIDALWTIAADQRAAGDQIVTRQLGPTDAIIAAMRCLFLGAASSEGWRRFLNVTEAITSSLPVSAARMPAGLDRLADAVRLYTRNSAS